MTARTERSLPPSCTCGAPLKNLYDADTTWPWADYECGTHRAMPGTNPFPNGGMVERTAMCRYAIALRQNQGMTPRQGAAMWKRTIR